MLKHGKRRVLALLAVAMVAGSVAVLPAVADDDHGAMAMVPAPAGMKISMTAKRTEKGVLLKVTPTKFRFAPLKIDGAHVPGQGHVHLYVDGKKLTVIAQGGYYYLAGLQTGTPTIQARLTANNHHEYMRGGKPVAATVKLTPPSKARTITVTVKQGKPVGGILRPTVKKGERVAIVVRTDVGSKVHLHGYDVEKAVVAGQATKLDEFVASISGRFDLELHDPDVVLAVITVK